MLRECFPQELRTLQGISRRIAGPESGRKSNINCRACMAFLFPAAPNTGASIAQTQSIPGQHHDTFFYLSSVLPYTALDTPFVAWNRSPPCRLPRRTYSKRRFLDPRYELPVIHVVLPVLLTVRNKRWHGAATSTCLSRACLSSSTPRLPSYPLQAEPSSYAPPLDNWLPALIACIPGRRYEGPRLPSASDASSPLRASWPASDDPFSLGLPDSLVPHSESEACGKEAAQSEAFLSGNLCCCFVNL